MGILGLLLLAACIAIACSIFNSKKSDLWGLKGAVVGVVLFFLVRWGIPILWGLLNFAVFLFCVAAVVAAIVIGVKLLAKHA